jgi:hypothetical protein
LEMAYMCFANEIMKALTNKNSPIVMAANIQFLATYMLESTSNGEVHHLVRLSLKVVIDKFKTLTFPNCRNFVYE